MEYVGENGAFGAELVELSPERSVDTLVESGETFPLGVRGLLPVVTARKKKGGSKTVFAFPCAAGVPSTDPQLARELADALGFLNTLLAEAADLSGFPFGEVACVQMGVPERGYGFTRVERTRLDGPSAAPIHLRVETSDVPGAAGSLNAVLEYDRYGRVQHVLMTEYGEGGHVCRATAAVDFNDGVLRIERVVEELEAGAEPVELFFWHNRRSGRWGDGGASYR